MPGHQVLTEPKSIKRIVRKVFTETVFTSNKTIIYIRITVKLNTVNSFVSEQPRELEKVSVSRAVRLPELFP